MGALLRDQAGRNFNGTKVHTFMYKGSESPHHPESLFKGEGDYGIRGNKKNKDVFDNKKAQNIIAFAERVRKTWEAVALGKYHNPDELVSFDSEKIPANFLQKLRSEACRIFKHRLRMMRRFRTLVHKRVNFRAVEVAPRLVTQQSAHAVTIPAKRINTRILSIP